MAVLMHWLLVIPVLVVYSQGQSEGINGLVDSNTLTEWSQLNNIVQLFDRQMLFLGIRFKCSGNLTKWIVGAADNTALGRDRYPTLGIYRPREDGDFDRVGVTVFEHPEFSPSRIYEFTPDPPLPFQTNDRLGIYIPPLPILRLRPLFRDTTGGPDYRDYNPFIPDDPVEGVEVFDITGTTIETNRLPLVAVEIESDDQDSASCTRDFISQDLLELLAPNVVTPNNVQIVFSSYNFTSDGFITSWTLGAQWVNEAGRNSFPELQIWRRNDNTYDRIGSTELIATAENSNQFNELYSDTIDPPLQFQSGDVLGMYLPNDDSNGSRLLVYFAQAPGQLAGPTYKFRDTNVPLSSIVLSDLQTDNDRPYLALEISLILQPSSTTNLESPSPSSTVIPPPTNGSPESPTTTIIIVVVICGLALAVAAIAVILIIILLCARKKDSNLNYSNVDAIYMTATDEVMYDYPFQQEKITISTDRNEAYATTIPTDHNEAYATTITTDPNEAYTTTITTDPNEAYATTIPTDHNEAYATTITTDPNEAYATTITTDPNEAYATTIPTDRNEAYATTIPTDRNEAYATTIPTDRNEAYATTITTDRNEAYATTITVAPNVAYSSTAVPLQSNEAYDTTHHGDTTADDEYEYI